MNSWTLGIPYPYLWDIDSEQKVLQDILIHNRAELLNELKERDFGRLLHRAVLRASKRLIEHGKPLSADNVRLVTNKLLGHDFSYSFRQIFECELGTAEEYIPEIVERRQRREACADSIRLLEMASWGVHVAKDEGSMYE